MLISIRIKVVINIKKEIKTDALITAFLKNKIKDDKSK